MDNITHTLVGLALADSGLKRRSRLGTAALLIGANLPDIDALVYFFGRGGASALAFRRGWTHGVLAMVVLPVALTAGLLGWDRLVRGSRDAPGTGPALHPARRVLAVLERQCNVPDVDQVEPDHQQMVHRVGQRLVPAKGVHQKDAAVLVQ